MDSVFLFIAEKLFILSPLVAVYFFYQAARETKIEMLIFAFFSLPLTFVLSMIARDLYYNPLPFVIGGFEPLLDHAPNNGFPSDHTLLLASIASLFTFFHRKASIALWAIAFVVGGARMYVGVHHLVDILGAVLIALLSAFIVHAVMLYRKKV